MLIGLDFSLAVASLAVPLPSLEQAWNDYRTKAQSRMIRPNYMQFAQTYQQIKLAADQNDYAKIREARTAGVSDKTFRKLAEINPDFHKKLVKLSSMDPTVGTDLINYLPKQSFSQTYGEDPGRYNAMAGAAVGVGITGASALLTQGTANEATAREKFRESAKGSKHAAANADKLKIKWLDTIKNGKSKEEIEKARNKYSKAREAIKTKRQGASTTYRDARKTRFGQLRDYAAPKSTVGKFALSSATYLAAPYIMQNAAEGLTGDEKIGEIANTGTRGAISARITYNSFKQALGKHGMQKIWSHIIKRKGIAFGAKLGLRGAVSLIGGTMTSGAVTALMAGWTLRDLQEVYRLISELE